MKFIKSVALGGALGAAVAAAGCTRDNLLGVQTPDIISPGDLNSPDGAEGLRIGVLRNFKLMTAADESSWFYGGLLVDEWKSADTFTQRNETDSRSVTEENTLVTVAYRYIHRARVEAYQAAGALAQFKPAVKGEIAEMYFVKGYAEMQAALDFCNGQPFADLSKGTPDIGVTISNTDAFNLALASFDSALAVANTAPATDTIATRVKFSAQVGRGRVLLNLGRQPEALTAVANIPQNFSFNLTWPGTQGKEDNFIWALTTSARRYTVQDSTDRQGGSIPNAMPFVSAKDPRVPTTNNALNPAISKLGFDGVTPYDGELVFPNFNSVVPVANYVDAQLILAEAQLAANNPAWLTTLNALRAGPTNVGNLTVSGMAPLTDPGTPTARLDLLFRERAFWTFGRGERLGDLRREIRVYGRTAAAVFPGEGGVNPRTNANYGPDVNLPVPQAERNNQNYTGCIDRKA